MKDEKRRRKRLRQRMQAIADQAAYERKLREPPPQPAPPAKHAEIIDVPGIVRAPDPRNEKLETLVACMQVIRSYGGMP